MTPGNDFSNMPCLAFRHPLVGAPGVGFQGGPVILGETHRLLRHTRYGEPVDWFDGRVSVDERLQGDYVYLGPVYHHFGHVMAEMVHRILPSKAATVGRTWLMLSTLGDEVTKSTSDLAGFMREVLGFFDIDPTRVHILSRDSIVERLHIAPMGSDFGRGPKKEYLAALRQYFEPLLAQYPGNFGDKVYVSRSALPGGGGLLGEAYIERIMARAGFTILRPEAMSLLDQMRAYRCAKVLVFGEGSACHGVELLGEGMLGTVILLARRVDHMEIFQRVLQPRAREYLAIPPSPLTQCMFYSLKHITTAPLAHEALFAALRARNLLDGIAFDEALFRERCATDFATQLAYYEAEQPSALDPLLVAQAREVFSSLLAPY